MRCVYINLADAQERRAWMDRHLADVAPPGIEPARFEAVTAAAAAGLPETPAPPRRPASRATVRP